jgi:hypothetical protein
VVANDDGMRESVRSHVVYTKTKHQQHLWAPDMATDIDRIAW